MDAHNGKSSARTGGWTGTHTDVFQSHKSYFSSFCWFIGSLQQQQLLQASTAPPSNKYPLTAPHVWWHFSEVFTFNQHLIPGKHIFFVWGELTDEDEKRQKDVHFPGLRHKKNVLDQTHQENLVFESILSYLALFSDKSERYRQSINSLQRITMLL